MMSSPPSSVISPTMAAIFDVPTSSPTRYRSLRATGPPSQPTSDDGRRSSPVDVAPPRRRRTSVRVAGSRRAAPAARRRARRTADPRSRCPARARAASARARGTTAAARRTGPRRGAAAPHRRRAGPRRRARRVTSICDSRCAMSVARRRARRSPAPPARRGRRRSTGAPAARRRATRPSMIGRSNSAYCGPNSSMTVPCAIDQIELLPEPAEPIGRRSDTNTSIVDGSTRRSATSATQGDSSSRRAIRRRRSARQDARAAQPVDERLHLAARQPHVAVHGDPAAPAAAARVTHEV